MDSRNIKKAVIAGSAALVWSICSLNIFGIIGTVACWAISGKPRRNGAIAAGVMYIIALLLSIGFGALLLTGAGVFGVFTFLSELAGLADGGMLRLFTGMSVFSLFGDVLYIIASVFCFKAAKELNSSHDENGFFD